ncbi:MAG: hypothetical protein AB1505_33185, partial [Candidatus Latescibacterota bacterium]
MELADLPSGASPEEVLAQYDRAAQALLDVAWRDGHFTEPQEWPAAAAASGQPGVPALERRARLIATIHDGIPPRRDRRLAEAHARFVALLPAYHLANRLFVALRRQFTACGQGDEVDFLHLYQAEYLEALTREDPLPLDEGEAALVQLRVARVPLSHAQSVAGKLAGPANPQDPRLAQTYEVTLDGQAFSGSLGSLQRQVAERVVDFLAAGEHLAIRFNTFSNFVWLGISVWKAITDAELLVARRRQRQRAGPPELDLMVLRGKVMLLRFLQAHLEDPAQIKPKEFWYGQEYSYLTRDMIDLVRELVRRVSALPADPTAGGALEMPPLLCGRVSGRFLEHRGVGLAAVPGTWRRRARLLRWAWLMRCTAR